MSASVITHINSATGNLYIFLLNPPGTPTSTEKDYLVKDVANKKSYHLSAFTPNVHIDKEQKHSSIPTSARKLISFAITCYILTDHFQEIKRWCFKTHFHSSYFSTKTNGKRFLWHWSVLMHSIIKGLFCIDELLCENKHKGRWHSANSGSFFKPTLLLCIIQSLVATEAPVLCRKLRTKAEVLNKIFHKTCSCCLLVETRLCFHGYMKAYFP